MTKAILSALGEDRVGILAAVSHVLAGSGVNIEDTRQTTMSGVFSMTMLVDLDEEAVPFEELRVALDRVARDLGVEIRIEREQDFRALHRV